MGQCFFLSDVKGIYLMGQQCPISSLKDKHIWLSNSCVTLCNKVKWKMGTEVTVHCNATWFVLYLIFLNSNLWLCIHISHDQSSQCHSTTYPGINGLRYLEETTCCGNLYLTGNSSAPIELLFALCVLKMWSYCCLVHNCTFVFFTFHYMPYTSCFRNCSRGFWKVTWISPIAKVWFPLYKMSSSLPYCIYILTKTIL